MKSLTILPLLALSVSACTVRSTAQVASTASVTPSTSATTQSATAPVEPAGNPFQGATQVVNPEYVAKVEAAAKPPGESDGTTDEKSPRFDQGCKSVDSMPNAPEGGQWFAEHFVDMVRNAEPKL
jgi:cellulase/cellobiase CelA1